MPRSFAHLSDEAVVALLARSDESALAELYDRFGRVAYGLALRVLRDERLAEDAVQEGFLAAWRNADRFMPERGKASTWLLTLVHRRAVDLVRREDRRRAEPLVEGVDFLANLWKRHGRRRLNRGSVLRTGARRIAGGSASAPRVHAADRGFREFPTIAGDFRLDSRRGRRASGSRGFGRINANITNRRNRRSAPCGRTARRRRSSRHAWRRD